MKKIILLAGSLLLCLVFPPKAWNQTYGAAAGGAEYLRQMQQKQQKQEEKTQEEQQNLQNKTKGLEEKSLYQLGVKKDQEDKQKTEPENTVSSSRTN